MPTAIVKRMKMKSWDAHSVRVDNTTDQQPMIVQQQHNVTPKRRSRFPELDENNKLFCLMLTLLILCASGVLIAVLVAGVVWASQTSG